MQVNAGYIRQHYSKVFDVIGKKAQCKFCLKDGVIDVLPQAGSFMERIATHLKSKVHLRMVERSGGLAQSQLSFGKKSL